MKDFDKICRDFENIDINTYAAVLTEKALKLIPALSAFSEDGLSGVELSLHPSSMEQLQRTASFLKMSMHSSTLFSTHSLVIP